MEYTLSHPFWPVKLPGGTAYGISQQWSAYPALRGWGCGTAAALMVLGYLHLYHTGGQSAPVDALVPAPSQTDCRTLLDTAGRKYFPVLPRHGINGLSLAFLLNRYFRRFHMPYTARWRSVNVLPALTRMLQKDIPVICSVGPDFPLLWQKHPLDLYAHPGDEKSVQKVRAHYMVVTGYRNGWLRLSSWGREYYLPTAAWNEHHKYHSGYLVDGIVQIRRRKEH